MTVERTFAFEDSPSVEDLQLQLRNTEVRLKLKSLEFRDTGMRKFTHGVFERTPAEPLLPDLRLVADPTGRGPPGEGEVEVCRGTASIRLTSTKVAAFRKAASTAAASGSAGAATPAPAQAPAPVQAPAAPATAPAPVEDTGTGPEGNPNLNSDGTPKTPAPKPPGGEG